MLSASLNKTFLSLSLVVCLCCPTELCLDCSLVVCLCYTTELCLDWSLAVCLSQVVWVSGRTQEEAVKKASDIVGVPASQVQLQQGQAPLVIINNCLFPSGIHYVMCIICA